MAIDEKKLIDDLKGWMKCLNKKSGADNTRYELLEEVIDLIEEQPKLSLEKFQAISDNRKLIYADKLIKEITIAQETLQTSDDKQWERNKKYFKGLAWAHKIVLEQPTIEAEPVRHGEWVSLEADIGLFACSNCGHKILRAECNYCPKCGAKMDKKSPENHKKYQGEETNKKSFK